LYHRTRTESGGEDDLRIHDKNEDNDDNDAEDKPLLALEPILSVLALEDNENENV
jgi:hypothetical protein